MKLLKQIVKKALLIFYSIYKKDLNVDYSSEISRIVYKNLKGNSKYKIVVKNSFLSGNIIAEEGCKFLDVTCTGNVKLGRFVSINGPATRISSRLNGIEIGSFSSIASNVVIQEDYHRSDKVSTYFMNRNIFNSGSYADIYSKGKIKIEEDVWIGSNSTILSGVTIGRGSIIGAGSVVTKDIPRYSIVAGNPAKVLKKRFPDDIINELEESKWWNFDVDKIIGMQDTFNRNLLDVWESNKKIGL